MRRVFWATLGAGFGFGLSFWMMRAIRRVADRWLPSALVERVGRYLDSLDGGTGSRRVQLIDARLTAVQAGRPAGVAPPPGRPAGVARAGARSGAR